MFLGYMLDEPVYEFHNRNTLNDIFIILMSVVVKGNKIAIVIVNAGSGDNRPAKIAPDIFGYNFRITAVRFRINIETFFMFTIAFRFDLFKRRTKFCLKKVEKGSTERIAEKPVIKVGFGTPEAGVTDAAFRNEAMDMGIPFKISAKGMEDAYKARGKKLGFIIFVEQTKDNTLNGFKETVKKRPVFKEEASEFSVNCENTVSVLDVDDLKGHRSSAVNGVFGATSRAKTAMASKRDKLEVATSCTAIHCTAKRRISAANHAVNVFDDRLARS